jgi:hypothetical protein
MARTRTPRLKAWPSLCPISLILSMIRQVMSKFVKFLSLSNSSELSSDHFPCQLCWPGGITQDPTVWPDEARPPLSMFSKIIPVRQTGKFNQIRSYDLPDLIIHQHR